MNDQINNQQFLILSEIKNCRTEFLNDTIQSFCGIDSQKIQAENFSFYKEYLHPEDYLEYQSHLSKLDEGEEKTITLRLRDKNGNWDPFYFTNRLYKANSKLVLSLGQPVTQTINQSELIESLNYDSLKSEYQNLLNSLDEGFCMIEMIYDSQGKPFDYLYLRTNAAFYKHVNFTNIIGRTMREVLKIPQVHLLDVFDNVAQTGESIRFHETNENIEHGWLDLFAFKMGNPESRKIGLLFRNITNKKREDEALQLELTRNHKNLEESNALLQSVFDTTNLGIAVLKTVYGKDEGIKDFKFIRVNKVLQEMYLKKDIIGHNYLDTSKYGVEMGIFDAYKHVMITGKAFDQEFYFDREGYDHWFRVTARKQNDLIITTLEDITERKEKAKELEDTVRFKQELIHATPEVIMIIDLNTFSIRYINKDLLPEVGLTREKISGKLLQDVIPYIHPRDREKVIDLHRNLLKASDKKIIEVEVRLKLKGATWEWFNIRGKIFKRRDAAWVDEYVLLIRNINQQKETQKALSKAEKLSIQGEIARTFAHELRNPLASIGMVSEVLNQKIKIAGNDDFDNYFGILKRSTKTLNDLVTTLLNVSNYSPSELEPADLGEVMDQIIHKAADRIYLSGIQVIKNYKGKFPILADKEKLEIALLNILVNSSEATIPGEGIIQIEIREHETDYMLSITDNGQGMDQDQIDHLFEAFYTKKDTGMGIGMSSVKNILDEHDAHIKVYSKLNEGATFKIYFHNENLK